MKSVLISIQPKWCELIASGKKMIEVRKTKPKLDVPFKCYIYCTEPKGKYDFGLSLDRGMSGNLKSIGLLCKCNYETAEKMDMTILSGKVIGEFVCDVINPIYSQSVEKQALCAIAIGNGDKEYYENSCVSYKEAYRYFKNAKMGYGWHISNLVIYDKPRKLGEFMNPCIDKDHYCPLCPFGSELFADGTEANEYGHICLNKVKRPPQSWCYVESEVTEE